MSGDLQRYAAKREEWLSRLAGADANAVQNQLTAMSWDLASYEIVGTAVEAAPRADNGEVQLNPLLLDLLARSFLASFMVFARRISDNGRSNDSMSLWRVLQDMHANARFFTRQNMMAAEDIEYDDSLLTPRSFEWLQTLLRHEAMDELTGVSSGQRSPTDSIHPALFRNLQERVERTVRRVKGYVDKFLAHSAGPRDHGRSTTKNAVVSYKELRACHQCFCEVTGFVVGQILWSSNPPTLAYPQYDQFEFIDRPLIGAADVGRLEEKWRELQEESHTWSQWGMDEYRSELS